MELEQLRIAAELMREHDGRDPAELLPPELPQPLMFEPNKAYLRHLLDTQIDLTTLGAGYVHEAHERFEQMQEALMGGEIPPSEAIIDAHRAQFGTDYRLETEGPHPAPELQQQAGKRA